MDINSELLKQKYSQFEQEIENPKKLRKTINQLFITEFDNQFPDILNLNSEQFLNNLEKSVITTLQEMYSENCKNNEKLQELIINGKNLIKFDYEKKYNFLLESWDKNCKRGYRQVIPNEQLLSSYRKHCPDCDEYATHNCRQTSKFITIKDEKNRYIKYIICIFCKKVYLYSFILCHCYKCKINYYSEMLKEENDKILLPATWENYHCEIFANENMRCIKCNQLFYINMRNGNLFCINRKCGFSNDPKKISWTCKICNLDFKTGARPYNPLELKIKNKIVENCLLIKNKAYPNKINCNCEIDIVNTDFFHNNKCNGILYVGKFENKNVIICSKCEDIIDFYEKFLWTCPKCGNTFKEKDKKYQYSFNNHSAIRSKKFYPKIKSEDKNIKKNDNNETNENVNNNNVRTSNSINSIGLLRYRRRNIIKEINNNDENNKDNKTNENKEDNKNDNDNNINENRYISKYTSKYGSRYNIRYKNKIDNNDNNKNDNNNDNNNNEDNNKKNDYNTDKNIKNEDNNKDNNINEINIIDNSNDNKENNDYRYRRRRVIYFSRHTSSESNIKQNNNLNNITNEKNGINSYNKKVSTDISSKNKKINSITDDNESISSVRLNYRNRKSLLSEEPSLKKNEVYSIGGLYRRKRYENSNTNASTEFSKNNNFPESKSNENKNEFELKKLYVNNPKKIEETKYKKYYHKKLPTIDVLTSSVKNNDDMKKNKQINDNYNDKKINIESKYNKEINEEIKTQENNENKENQENKEIVNRYRYRHHRIFIQNNEEKKENDSKQIAINSSTENNKKNYKNPLDSSSNIIHNRRIIIRTENKEEKYKSVEKSNIEKLNISESLKNGINQKINEILSRSKIPFFNIDEYVFDKQIGEGSNGIIYMVYQRKNRYRKFAIKKIVANDLGKLDEFTKEFELVHKCEHNNILKIFGINLKLIESTTYCLHILMELALTDWNKDISNRLKDKNKYTENELINILYQLSNALLFMQQNLRVSHRDIKPQNILIFSDNIFKLADFGEAKKAKIGKKMNTLRGTELYMSPSLYNGLKKEEDDVAHNPYKSDVFSLGLCILYASTLNFNMLYLMRELTDNRRVNYLINTHLRKYYSNEFIDIISNMLQIDEDKRYDFKEIVEFIKTKYNM